MNASAKLIPAKKKGIGLRSRLGRTKIRMIKLPNSKKEDTIKMPTLNGSSSGFFSPKKTRIETTAKRMLIQIIQRITFLGFIDHHYSNNNF